MEQCTGESSTMRKKLIHAKVKTPDLKSLKKYAGLLTNIQRSAFINKYGMIIKLLDIEVQPAAITALSQFYDPSFRCFTFKDFQLAPTLEEYSQILGYSLENIKPYSCTARYYSSALFGSILGVEEEDLNLEEKKRNNYPGFPQKYLEARMEYFAGVKNWPCFIDVLAVTIYGIILFPHIDEYIDRAAIEVFLAVRDNGKNPIPAVLADTYLTFTYCTEKKGKRLLCCTSVLYVWLINRVFTTKYKIDGPFNHFKICDVKAKTDQEWAQILIDLDQFKVRWCPEWRETTEVIYRCGDYPFVPLIGTKGCINYNPRVALRQFGYPMMNALDEELLSPFVIYGNDSENAEEIRRIRQAWDKVVKKSKELGKRSCGANSVYRKWLKERVDKIQLPFQATIVEEAPEPHAITLEEVDKMQEKLSKLEAENEHLIKENENLNEELREVRKSYMDMKYEDGKRKTLLEETHAKAEKEKALRQRTQVCLRQSDYSLKLHKQERDRGRATIEKLKKLLKESRKENEDLKQKLESRDDNRKRKKVRRTCQASTSKEPDENE